MLWGPSVSVRSKEQVFLNIYYIMEDFKHAQKYREWY